MRARRALKRPKESGASKDWSVDIHTRAVGFHLLQLPLLDVLKIRRRGLERKPGGAIRAEGEGSARESHSERVRQGL